MATEDIGGPMTAHEVDAARLCFAPRNADGSVKELPGVSYGTVNDAEIARRREQLREGHAAARAEAALRYPADGGLKEQVRPFCQTQSLNDVLEAERKRQQQDPAHDQSPFFDTSHKDEPKEIAGANGGPLTVHELMYGKPAQGTIHFNGETVQFTGLSIAMGAPQVTIGMEEALPERVDVTGTFIAYFDDETLRREFEHEQRAREELWAQYLFGPHYDHPVVRELKWAFHNLIAHPISEITHWLGYLHPKIRDAGLWLHDISVPQHAPNTGRG